LEREVEAEAEQVRLEREEAEAEQVRLEREEEAAAERLRLEREEEQEEEVEGEGLSGETQWWRRRCWVVLVEEVDGAAFPAASHEVEYCVSAAYRHSEHVGSSGDPRQKQFLPNRRCEAR
jgi:hypothetical protein